MLGARKRIVASAVAGTAMLPVAVAFGQYGPGYGGGAPSSGSSGQSSQRPRDVKAEGNIFTGGLAFDPHRVAVRVGQVVRWTNTDFLVPHTATEDHGLWDLGGTYGGTPANPSGFGPGESRSRVFEAGTQNYYCRVHPKQMRGVVAVPVRLSRKTRSKHGRKRYLVIARWASKAPVAGEAFDVEVMRAGGSWRRVRTATRTMSMRFDGGKVNTRWSVRARLRSGTIHPRKATEYAHSLKHDGSAVPAGHLELLGAVVDDELEIIRVVEADPALLRQLPPDWRP